jgi:hypothetical protein
MHLLIRYKQHQKAYKSISRRLKQEVVKAKWEQVHLDRLTSWPTTPRCSRVSSLRPHPGFTEAFLTGRRGSIAKPNFLAGFRAVTAFPGQFIVWSMTNIFFQAFSVRIIEDPGWGKNVSLSIKLLIHLVREWTTKKKAKSGVRRLSSTINMNYSVLRRKHASGKSKNITISICTTAWVSTFRFKKIMGE